MLEASRFPKYFCRWIKVLFKDSSTIIDVNGNLTSPIPLGRSIRHGCPISHSLFVITIDTLFYILRAPSHGHPIKGLLLPNEDTLLYSQLTDDIAFVLGT